MYQLQSNSYIISIPRESLINKDKYMKFYPSFYEALSSPSITDQEFRLAIQLMYQLYFEGLEIKSEELPASLYAPFRLIGENLKANRNRSRINSENGKKGGAKTKENAEKARILDTEHSAGNTDPELIMETMLEDVQLLKTKKKSFEIPSVEDLKKYAEETGLVVDVNRFFDFYQSNGWKVGRNPMKDWKATLRNWARRNVKDNSAVPEIPSKKFYETKPCPECGKKLLIWDNETQKYTCENCKRIFKLGDII